MISQEMYGSVPNENDTIFSLLTTSTNHLPVKSIETKQRNPSPLIRPRKEQLEQATSSSIALLVAVVQIHTQRQKNQSANKYKVHLHHSMIDNWSLFG